MNKSTEYIDRLKVTYNGASDYKVAQLLDVSHTVVRYWRNGRSSMGVKAAVKCAELLGIDPKTIVLEVHQERSKSPEEKEFWSSLIAA